MTSRRQPSGKGKERRDPPANREDDFEDDYNAEEQPIPPPKDERILSFIPNDGIDYGVIRTEVQSFLGPEASVTRGKHPKVRFSRDFRCSSLNSCRPSARVTLSEPTTLFRLV
jgi:hypothetical protein